MPALKGETLRRYLANRDATNHAMDVARFENGDEEAYFLDRSRHIEAEYRGMRLFGMRSFCPRESWYREDSRHWQQSLHEPGSRRRVGPAASLRRNSPSGLSTNQTV
jgi:hypothetical protein